MSELKARFHVKTRIDKCVCDSSFRYSLDSLYLCPARDDAERVYLTATDGKILAVNRVDGNTSAVYRVPPKAIPTVKTGGHVSLNGQWFNERQSKVCDNVDVQDKRYPRVSDAIADVDESMAFVSLDAKLLRKLLGAVCAESGRDDDSNRVTLFVRGWKDPVSVHGPDGIGVIMPLNKDHKDKRTDKQYHRGKVAEFNSYAADYRESFKESQQAI